MQSPLIADRSKNLRSQHMPERHQGQKNSRASADALLSEQPGDKQKYQSAHQSISDLMDDAKKEGQINICINHQDLPQPRNKKRKKKDLLIEPRIESQKGDRKARKGQKKKRDRYIQGKLEVVQIEIGLQKRTVNRTLHAPMEGEDEDKDGKQDRFSVDKIQPVLLQGDHAELFLPDFTSERQDDQKKGRIDKKEKTKAGKIHQSSPGDRSRRCAQSQPEGQCPVFFIEVQMGIIFVVKAIDGDIQGVVRDPHKEENATEKIKIMHEGQ